MSCVVTFDIGTTAVKAVLVGEDGQAEARLSRDIPTLYGEEFREQDPAVWWEAFRDLSAELLRNRREEILGIVMSGQMQDVIPVDRDLKPLCPADGRMYPRAAAAYRTLEKLHAAGRLEFTAHDAVQTGLHLK